MNLMRSSTRAFLLLISVGCLKASILALNPTGDYGAGFSEATVSVSQALERADKYEVFEGLPHPFEGKKFLENEILYKGATTLDENWFYSPPQPMADEDKASLQRLFGADLFKPWRGYKFCGGFHGDYAVRFVSAGETYLVLFCFSCHEARILRIPQVGQNDQRPAGFRLTADLSDAGFKELPGLFKRYHKNRPSTPAPAPKSKLTPPAPPRVPVQL